MVKRLLIGVVVLLLLGGSFVGLTVMGVVPDVAGLKPMLGLADPAAGEGSEAAQAPPPPPPPDYGPDPVFMRLPQFAIPVIAEGQAGRHLNLSLRLHVDPDSRADVTRAIPRLTDVILTGLVQKMPELIPAPGRLDLPAMKAVLNGQVTRAMGDGPVHDVLIDGAYIR
ncbi:hypothetical protein [Roseospira navarrensis]|uniref:Flagellar protein FliL n=1 Tax=Roseospira navarrensis TaxID=140058 RepID=A0A7X1ZD65_9PROT|nr:hypothetical protein [Roseospira navarrensis]MQX35055.1 hypothetical protein [Roseospira navarrensis]